MPFTAYERYKPQRKTLAVIDTINDLLDQYAAQGFDTTLRQLYYQFVARDLFPDDRVYSYQGGKWVKDPNGTKNAETNYDWLGAIVNKARMGGLIDWDRIVDRTRRVRSISHWETPVQIVAATAAQFKVDRWQTQRNYVEVWVEKDAVVGIVEDVCTRFDVPYYSGRGYSSQSAMWRAARERLLERVTEGRHVTVVYLGDHDPSGLDMGRDIADRLWLFIATDYWHRTGGPQDDAKRHVSAHLEVDRIALTMAQVRQYNPPPNPTKLSDSRAARYVAQHGHESWELDALAPPVLDRLIRDAVRPLVDAAAWRTAEDKEAEGQELLRAVSRQWEKVVATLNGSEPTPPPPVPPDYDDEAGEWEWEE